MSLFFSIVFSSPFFPHRSHALIVYLHEQVHKFLHVGKKKGLDLKNKLHNEIRSIMGNDNSLTLRGCKEKFSGGFQ